MLSRFDGTSCLIFALLLACFGCLLFFALRLQPEDALAYQLLMQTNSELHSKSAIDALPIEQKRRGVRKDLWTRKGHFQVEAAGSSFTLIQRKNRWDPMEVFDRAEGSDDQASFVSASSGYADSELFFLEGDLRLIFELDGKKSVALADTAYFDPKKEKLILQSLPTKRVLLQQEGLQMSAQSIEIGDEIEGIGDVRFYLTKEEKLCF